MDADYARQKFHVKAKDQNNSNFFIETKRQFLFSGTVVFSHFYLFLHTVRKQRKKENFMQKKFLSMLLVGILAVSALPLTVFAEHKKTSDEKKLKKITLNEVAHSIFYAHQYVALENGYFEEEGLDVTMVTGFGADKVMTALLSGEADIGFMGAEASIYAYQEGATDPVINFAQGTQRAGNFLVAREPISNFSWEDLKGKTVLGGRKGVLPRFM